MSTYSERAVLAADPVFISRVRLMAIKVALGVCGNSATIPSTTNAGGDLRIAKSVLGAPEHWGSLLAQGVATNPNVGSGSSDPSTDNADGDSALEYVMAAVLWPAYAKEEVTEVV